jgi:hypothetical protein
MTDRTSNSCLPLVALVLASVPVMLVGGVSAVRVQSALDGFDPNANDDPRRCDSAGWKGSHRRRFYHPHGWC